jgi:hypothetical protein
MVDYAGSCHCGDIQFSFSSEPIKAGIRCNCSICTRKGAVLSPFVVRPEDFRINAGEDSFDTYEFGSMVAKHHYCCKCGIFPFSQTKLKPGHYRINLGCVENIDIFSLPVTIFDGRNI